MAAEPIFNVGAASKLVFTKRDLARLLFKHKAVILGTFVLGLVLASAAGWLIPSFYNVTAKVLIKQELANMPSFFSGIASVKDSPTTNESLSNRVHNAAILAQSGVVLVPAVRELKLRYKDIALRWYKYLIDPLLDRYYWFNTHILGFPPDPERHGQNVVIAQFAKSLDVEVVTGSGGSSLLATPGTDTSGPSVISFTLTVLDPNKGVDELRLLIRNFIDYEKNLQVRAARDAYAYVQRRADLARGKLDAADAALKRFIAQEGGVAATSGPTVHASSSILSTAAGTGFSGLISTPQDSTTITMLKSQLVKKEAELVDLHELYRGQSPKEAGVINSMQDLKERINREQAKIAANNERITELQRNVTLAQHAYELLQDKLQQIGIYLHIHGGNQVGDLQLVDPPRPPTESLWKKRLAIVGGTAFGGLILGIGFAGYREATDRRYRSDDEVRSQFGVEMVIAIPAVAAGVVEANLDRLVHG